MTPDWSATPVPVPYAELGNPQSLNLYSYVQNNPITGIDPDGHAADPSNHPATPLESVPSTAGNAEFILEQTITGEGQKDESKNKAQDQSAAPVPNTQAQQIPGTSITQTSFQGAEFSNHQYGVTIGASCADCSAWVQTITRTGAGDTHGGKEYVDNGSTPSYHYTNPIYGGGNHFSDMPTAPKNGSFKGVVWAGSADLKNKAFTTQGAFAYSFSVSKSGKLSVMPPRAATKAEQINSLKTIRAESSGWTIN